MPWRRATSRHSSMAIPDQLPPLSRIANGGTSNVPTTRSPDGRSGGAEAFTASPAWTPHRLITTRTVRIRVAAAGARLGWEASGLEREVEEADAPRADPVVHATEEQPRPERTQLAQDAAQRQRVLRDVVVELETWTGAIDHPGGCHAKLGERTTDRADAPDVRAALTREALAAPRASGRAQHGENPGPQPGRQSIQPGEVDLHAPQLPGEFGRYRRWERSEQGVEVGARAARQRARVDRWGTHDTARERLVHRRELAVVSANRDARSRRCGHAHAAIPRSAARRARRYRGSAVVARTAIAALAGGGDR